MILLLNTMGLVGSGAHIVIAFVFQVTVLFASHQDTKDPWGSHSVCISSANFWEEDVAAQAEAGPAGVVNTPSSPES